MHAKSIASAIAIIMLRNLISYSGWGAKGGVMKLCISANMYVAICANLYVATYTCGSIRLQYIV